eukprot:CAMPEP_0169148888 /NCGR_PEP_ID=MMETSP1015-20121227/49151_1 /TAXON_ID=342587 /ORGANISM="Karlodinium micrum, Strain CCMP2283" /LENGTH=100 /DNA_ID=CAMNT_0009217507 /DNA_START=233 /DNA_END=534 /DNA_ORIENTATION=-
MERQIARHSTPRTWKTMHLTKDAAKRTTANRAPTEALGAQDALYLSPPLSILPLASGRSYGQLPDNQHGRLTACVSASAHEHRQEVNHDGVRSYQRLKVF